MNLFILVWHYWGCDVRFLVFLLRGLHCWLNRCLRPWVDHESWLTTSTISILIRKWFLIAIVSDCLMSSCSAGDWSIRLTTYWFRILVALSPTSTTHSHWMHHPLSPRPHHNIAANHTIHSSIVCYTTSPTSPIVGTHPTFDYCSHLSPPSTHSLSLYSPPSPVCSTTTTSLAPSYSASPHSPSPAFQLSPVTSSPSHSDPSTCVGTVSLSASRILSVPESHVSAPLMPDSPPLSAFVRVSPSQAKMCTVKPSSLSVPHLLWSRQAIPRIPLS